MAAIPVPVSTTPSRRALLAGALGGIGALVASAIGRAGPVRGADGTAVHVGDELHGSTVTRITNGSNANTVIWGESVHGVGVVGTSNDTYGVLGTSNSYSAVRGTNTSGHGVHGSSDSNNGVRGDSTSGYGVIGESTSNVGVFGSSYTVQGIRGVGVIGVEGVSANQYGWGVGGSNTASGGTGVWGQANGAGSRGVGAYSDTGHALHAESPLGWAGWFDGKVFTKRYHEIGKVATPAHPSANKARLFVRDNGSGKLQLCVLFPTGASQVIKTEP